MLSKDVVRRRLFGEAVDYSREQDDRAMAALYDEAVALLAGGTPGVLVDGRTFTRRAAVDALVVASARARARLLVVECRCAMELARERLAGDVAAGAHLAANRDAELHARLAAQAEPLALPPGVPHVVVDTGSGTTVEHVAAVLAALRGRGPAGPTRPSLPSAR